MVGRQAAGPQLPRHGRARSPPVQTRLALATFDPSDATLTTAGACGPCAFNSGNQPELPGMSAPTKPESHCGNLQCFANKTAAQFKRIADAAKAEGKKVIEGKKAAA